MKKKINLKKPVKKRTRASEEDLKEIAKRKKKEKRKKDLYFNLTLDVLDAVIDFFT